MTSTQVAADDAQLNPDTFDLDSWLEGVTRNKAVVTLNARQDLSARLDELVEKLQIANETLLDRDKTEQSITEAGQKSSVDLAERDRLRSELKTAWAEFEAFGLDYELTQMSSAEYDIALDEMNKQHPEPPFDAADNERARVQALRETLGAELILLGSVTAAGPHGKPRTTMTLTRAQLSKMQNQFGLRQYGQLVGEAKALTLLDRTVDAPFSLRVSDALTEDTSDN